MALRIFTGGREPVPYRGVLWAAVAAVVLLILAYGLRQVYEEEDGERPPPPREAPAPPPPKEPGTAVGVLPASEPEGPAEDVPAYLTDPTVLEDAPYGRTLHSYAFYYLLYQMKTADLAALAKHARPAARPEEMADRKPGAAVSLTGTIVGWAAKDDLRTPGGEVAGATYYGIEGSNGTVYDVYTVLPMSGLTRADRVHVIGRFLRLWRDEPEGAEGGDRGPPTPVIIARAVDGSHYLNDPVSLTRVKDGTFGREGKGLYYLANQVRGLTQEQLKARADTDLDPEQLVAAPAAARGKAVVAEGAIMRIREVELGPNIAGLERYYWTILRTRSGIPFWVFTLEEPQGLRERQPVRAYGLFLKLGKYESKDKYERTALLAVGRRLVPLAYKDSSALVWPILAVGAAVVVVLVIATRIERRRSRAVAEHVRGLSAAGRPRDLDAVGRAVASRARHTKDKLRETPDDAKPGGERPGE